MPPADSLERLAAARRALAVASEAVGVAAAPALHPGRGPIATGIAGLDEALGGGLPRGRIVEVTGPRSSGRLSLTLALLSRALHTGEPAALIDAADALDPRALHPDDRPRLLWVRPPDALTALQCADLLLDGGGFGLVALYLAGVAARTPDGARARVAPRPYPRVGEETVGPTARRGISSASWARLAQRAERSQSGLLVVLDARAGYAPGAFAHASLGARKHEAVWRGRQLLETVHCKLIVTRNKLAGGARGGATTEVVFHAG